MPPTKQVLASAIHADFRNDMISLLRKYAGKLTAEEMLALSAHMTGQIIALQDQSTMTRDMALTLVTQNVEQGNLEAVQGLMKTEGRA